MEKDVTTIQVSQKSRIKLNIMKQKLGCKNIEELIDRILKIIPASDLIKPQNNNAFIITKKQKDEILEILKSESWVAARNAFNNLDELNTKLRS